QGLRDANAITILPACRGLIKQELIKLGYPVNDLAGYHQGEALAMKLKANNQDFQLRDYQLQAVAALCADAEGRGGSGVVVLPCGAGKTVVGIAAMAELQCATLILTTNVAAVRQWRKEILDKTDLS